MKCLFCDIAFEDDEAGFSTKCKSCLVDFRWYGKEIIFLMFFYRDEYCIGINIYNKQTTLWKKNSYEYVEKHGEEYKEIYLLNSKADINPTNVNYWFDKLINLKAFS